MGGTVESLDITIYYTGQIKFEITCDADAATPTFDEVALESGVLKNLVPTVPGSLVRYRIIGQPGTIISAQKDAFGKLTLPGISIKNNYA